MAHDSTDRQTSFRRSPGGYLIGDAAIAADDAGLQPALAEAYKAAPSGARPRCLCRAPHPELYITKVAGQFLLKRMPGTGVDHDPSCSSYDPPPELSGLGQVLGSAISEDPNDGSTVLKLGFALTKIGRKAPVRSEAEREAASTSGARLSLRGLLHFLWEEAGFNRWTPAMSGKRHWGVVRFHLLRALDRKHAKGLPLSEAVFVPDVWVEQRKDEIAHRHRAALLKVASADRGQRKLLLLIGEVRRLEPGRFGHRLVLKHAPDVDFQVPEDLMKQLQRRFETELSFWRDQGDQRDRGSGHLIAIGTFAAWIPIEDAFDHAVIDQLLVRGGRFVKGLRYNLPATRPVACAVMQDTAGGPTALYIVRPGSTETFEKLLEDVVAESRLTSWIWRVPDGETPLLPEVARPGRVAPVAPLTARGDQARPPQASADQDVG
jgi:hypothetical protein